MFFLVTEQFCVCTSLRLHQAIQQERVQIQTKNTYEKQKCCFQFAQPYKLGCYNEKIKKTYPGLFWHSQVIQRLIDAFRFNLQQRKTTKMELTIYSTCVRKIYPQATYAIMRNNHSTNGIEKYLCSKTIGAMRMKVVQLETLLNSHIVTIRGKVRFWNVSEDVDICLE